MNKKVGFLSAIAVTICVSLFAIALIFTKANMSYFVCLLLSWSYILLICSFATQTSEDKKTLAFAGIAFATLYAMFVDIVYFTQLTTVAQQNASADILEVLSFSSLGSLIFNFDLLGYGLMAISTFLIGLTIVPKTKADKWLKILLMVHGVFAISCVLMPMLGIFNADMDGGDKMGTLALLFWCIYFIPIGILSAVHFKQK